MAATVEDVSDTLQLVVSSVEKFSSEFCKIYYNSVNSNVICSPLSVNAVLAMLGYGSGGLLQKQLHGVLGLGFSEDAFQPGYGNLVDSLNVTKDVEVTLANKLFASSRIPIKAKYLELLKMAFRSSVESVDFSNASAAAKQINSWCEEQTRGKIRDIVSANELNSDTGLVLANALYFKGQWKDKFDPLKTTEMPFYTDKTNFRNVATMKKTGHYNHGFIDELRARFIEMPYAGGQLSLVIILPVEFEGLERLKQNIDQINISEVLKTGFQSSLELHLPKFKIATTIDLYDTLEKMGIGGVFSPGANFCNITDSCIKVRKAVQKDFIVVNEDGSEAAAVSGVIAVTRSMPMCFSINQPFIFQLVKIVRDKDDIRNALPLFAGVVQEPKFDD